jgi:hypothetical protein
MFDDRLSDLTQAHLSLEFKEQYDSLNLQLNEATKNMQVELVLEARKKIMSIKSQHPQINFELIISKEFLITQGTTLLCDVDDHINSLLQNQTDDINFDKELEEYHDIQLKTKKVLDFFVQDLSEIINISDICIKESNSAKQQFEIEKQDENQSFKLFIRTPLVSSGTCKILFRLTNIPP